MSDNAIFLELAASRLSDLVDQMARHQTTGDLNSLAICQAQAEDLASAMDDLSYDTMYVNDLETNYLHDHFGF